MSKEGAEWLRELAASIEADPGPQSEGMRLGQALSSDPELATARAAGDREFLSRFVDYITGGGSDLGSVATRLERLKFETIVTGKTYGEVLAEAEALAFCLVRCFPVVATPTVKAPSR